MKHGFFLVSLAALLPACLILDEEPSKTVDQSLARECYDLVLLGDARPVLIRLHVRVEGKPLRQAWDDFIDGLFRYLDRDGDGVLSQAELQQAPRPQLLAQLLRGNFSE